MHRHSETRILAYSPEQMFDLVADIDTYPVFLPWCADAHVQDRQADGKMLTADLTIGFGPWKEKYTSRVALDRPRRIDVVGIRGPFRHLENRWDFTATKDGGCSVAFAIDFAFRSLLLQAMMSAVFHRAVGRMVESFENRARQAYGDPARTGPRRSAQPAPSQIAR